MHVCALARTHTHTQTRTRTCARTRAHTRTHSSRSAIGFWPTFGKPRHPTLSQPCVGQTWSSDSHSPNHPTLTNKTHGALLFPCLDQVEGKPPQCPGGHDMIISSYSGGAYRRGYYCNTCRGRSYEGHCGGGMERWFCQQCSVDYCFECEPKVCVNPTFEERDGFVVEGNSAAYTGAGKSGHAGCLLSTKVNHGKHTFLFETNIVGRSYSFNVGFLLDEDADLISTPGTSNCGNGEMLFGQDLRPINSNVYRQTNVLGCVRFDITQMPNYAMFCSETYTNLVSHRD